MRVVGRYELAEFMAAHANSRPAFGVWLATVTTAAWTSPADVLATFPRASSVRSGVMVFRLKGNSYRLAARIDFAGGVVRILAVGTHAEYSRWEL